MKLTIYCSNPECGDPSFTSVKSKREMNHIEEGIVRRYLLSLSGHVFQCPESECGRKKVVSKKWFSSGYNEIDIGDGKYFSLFSICYCVGALSFMGGLLGLGIFPNSPLLWFLYLSGVSMFAFIFTLAFSLKTGLIQNRLTLLLSSTVMIGSIAFFFYRFFNDLPLS